MIQYRELNEIEITEVCFKILSPIRSHGLLAQRDGVGDPGDPLLTTGRRRIMRSWWIVCDEYGCQRRIGIWRFFRGRERDLPPWSLTVWN